jgi:hypothetical protein
MLTRTAAHYPNSGHTEKTLMIVAEDWFHTFRERLTDRAFIEAVTSARRKCKFFPTETDIFDVTGLNPGMSCEKCDYNQWEGGCVNLKKVGFVANECTSFKPIINSN